MTIDIHCDVSKRHDFVLLFDVTDGNPNGDPDAGNQPRVDPETMQGLVSDVAIKRKVRDFVDMAKGEESRYKIYVQSGEALNARHRRAYADPAVQAVAAGQAQIDQARDWMCQNFYDIRMFGAVMTTKVNCGQVRGPLQVTFARSIDQIVPLDLSITRVAVTREEDLRAAVFEDGESKGGKQTEMGRKSLVPYGLYLAHGFFNPHFAKRTGATMDDLALFWTALGRMWDFDRSAARGLMACQRLYVFSHESDMGNAPAHKLFERVTVAKKPEVDAPRSFRDYVVDVNLADMPTGVTFTNLVG
jgi:CRISPR-associated protein Csd2